MPRRKPRRLEKPEEFSRAKWYLAQGYPQSFVAAKLGVHRNTVQKWSQLLGYTVAGEPGVVENQRTALSILRRFRKLAPATRTWLVQKLAKVAA